MLEYLYNLLEDIDRCDITSAELYRYIDENTKILKDLKTRNKSFQSGGTGGTGGIEEKKEKIDYKTADIADILGNMSEEMRETDGLIAKIDKTIGEIDNERDEETVEVVGVISDYLKELSGMVDSKPYSELQDQIGEIKDTLEGYVGEDSGDKGGDEGGKVEVD